jgi:hypothetical protein
MMTFPVDDVAPVTDRLPTRPLGEFFPAALAIGGDRERPVVVPDGVHPLLSAVGRAFAEHRPLVLSPDAVWLTIAQGVAQHVRLNAERLRPRLVNHAGRRRITVGVSGAMPAGADGWVFVIDLLGKAFQEEIAEADLFECDFSTSTTVERIAGRVTLLDAYSPYFAAWVRFVCGIPSITLTGTLEDWQKIRARVDRLSRYELDTWCRSLAPIADQFVRAAGGDVDAAFWRRIYSPADAYGGHVITGWAARLYPYLQVDGPLDQPNPLLDLPIDEPRDLTEESSMGYGGPGVRSDEVPATLSHAVVNINDQAGGDNLALTFFGGLVGIEQDASGALIPVAGWHIEPARVEIDDVIDRIVREHETTPPPEYPAGETGELVAIYHRIGSATLFNGRWRLLAGSEHGHVRRRTGGRRIVTVIEIADGRHIGAAIDETAEVPVHWVACRVQPEPPVANLTPALRLVDDPAQVPVLGTSLAFLLQSALDADGDIDHLVTGALSDLQT